MSCKHQSRAAESGLAEASADLRAHIEICEDCRATARRTDWVGSWLRTASPRSLGEQLDEPAQGRLLSKLTAQRARERKAHKQPALAIACTLALLTAAAGWIPSWNGIAQGSPSSRAKSPEVWSSSACATRRDLPPRNISDDAVARAFPMTASCLPPVLATVGTGVTPWSIAAALEGGPVPLDAVPLLSRFALEEEPSTARRALSALGRAGGAASAAAASRAFDRPEVRREVLASLRQLAEGGCEEARAAAEVLALQTTDALLFEDRTECWRIGIGGADSPGLASALQAALLRDDAAARTAVLGRATRLRSTAWSRALESCGRALATSAAEEALIRLAWESRAVGLVPWIKERIPGPHATLALRTLARIGSPESLEIFVNVTCGPTGKERCDASHEAWTDLDMEGGRALALHLRAVSSSEIAGRALGHLAHTRTLGARTALESLRCDPRLGPAARFGIGFLDGRLAGCRADRDESPSDARLDSAIARLENERLIEIGFVSSLIPSRAMTTHRRSAHSLGL